MKRIVAALIVIAGACSAGDAPPANGPDLLGDKPHQQGPPEGRMRPEEMLKAADTNHDGKVSKEELEAALAKQRQAGKEKMFDLMDANHDGTVSKEEFLAFEPPRPPGPPGKEGGPPGQGPGGPPGQGPGGPPGQGDGQKRGRGPEGQAGRRPEPSADMIMKHFDLNGDGFITEDEIQQAKEQRKEKGGQGPGDRPRPPGEQGPPKPGE